MEVDRNLRLPKRWIFWIHQKDDMGREIKRQAKLNFKGISLEQKWKERNGQEYYSGSKSGGQFMRTVIDYKGRN